MPRTHFPVLSCKDSYRLADMCATVFPAIWTGVSGVSAPSHYANKKRQDTFVIFCQKILKATQVSSACVFLALYYIRCLRSQFPHVRGPAGSEIRLLTTALLLANKFLDDNTFTNKTWSDVSSIPLRELNIMELEFLAALDYRIHVHHHLFFSWVSMCQRQWTVLSRQHRATVAPSQSLPNLSFSPKPSQSCHPPISFQKRSAEHLDRHTLHPCNKRIQTGNPPRRVPISCSQPSPVYALSPPDLTPASVSTSIFPSWKRLLSSSTSLTSLASQFPQLPYPYPKPAQAPSYSYYHHTYSSTLTASSIATAAAAAVNVNHAMLVSRVRCLDLE